jgi:transposase
VETRLTMEEVKKFHILEDFRKGYLKAIDVANILGVTREHVYWLKKKVDNMGIDGLIHGNRGNPSPRKIEGEIEEMIKTFYQEQYRGFNISHFTEKLNENEGVKISREKVRHLLLESGLYERRNHPVHRAWREPMPKGGMMLQYDTSDHDFLEGRGPRLYLIGGIDDATNEVPFALFFLKDGTIENMIVLKEIFIRKGLPLSIYLDRDSKFITTRKGGLHIELKDGVYETKTQMARALEELGIRMIYANSPQAKGRIERLWGTFQDRLVSEMRYEKIDEMKDANEYLLNIYLPSHNKKFSRQPALKESAWREIPENIKLENILCIKDKRKVKGDSTISYKGKWYKVLPTKTRYGFAKAEVEIQEYLDGSLHIFYKGEELPVEAIEKREKADARFWEEQVSEKEILYQVSRMV